MALLPNTYIWYYNEAVIQLGFIAFFAVSFPLAPLFSFLTNILEVMIKLKIMAEFGRRGIAQCSAGIGNWMNVMNFISYFAIPINMGVLLFARNTDVKVGSDQDLDLVPVKEQSALTAYFMKESEFWTRTNIFIFVVCMEHLIIGLKIVIAILIPDVPFNVKKAEEKRVESRKAALKELEQYKATSELEIVQVETIQADP